MNTLFEKNLIEYSGGHKKINSKIAEWSSLGLQRLYKLQSPKSNAYNITLDDGDDFYIVIEIKNNNTPGMENLPLVQIVTNLNLKGYSRINNIFKDRMHRSESVWRENEMILKQALKSNVDLVFPEDLTTDIVNWFKLNLPAEYDYNI